MKTPNRRAALSALAAFGLAACGGSSSSGGGSTSGFSQGTVQRFGSIVVNGVEWRTQGATLLTPDDSTTRRTLSSEAEIQQHVRRGDVVRVRGRLDDGRRSGQATEIEFHHSVEGVVSGRTDDSFTVGGVRVSVDANTRVHNSAGVEDNSRYAAIADNQRVQVSGIADDRGGLRATSIRQSTVAGTETEVKGFVLAGTAPNTFRLALAPDGAAAYVVIPGAFAIPAVGSFVEVKGNAAAGTPPTLTMTREAQAEDDFKGQAQAEAEVEGIVLSGTLAEFNVGSTRVRTGANTVYTGIPDGSSAAAEFAPGVKVEAEGSIDASGVLVARKVKFKDGARIGGVVSGATGALPGVGTFKLLGGSVDVATDNLTEVQIDPGAQLNGGFAEIRGYKRAGANGRVYAQRIRLRQAGGGGGDRPYLQGLVETKAAPGLTIMGISVTTGASTEFQDENEVLLGVGAAGQTAFFNLVNEGRTIVKVKWNAQSSPLTEAVKEAEIEAEDD